MLEKDNKIGIFKRLYNLNRVYIFLFVYAICIMLLCAGSSPLIKYLSTDSNVFYVMGRSATVGKVWYKEIVDHKGFYLFVFNWLGASLTPGSMNGLLVVEIIFAWIKLVFVYKTAYLYTTNVKNSILVAVTFMMVATNYLTWNTGNVTEEFALAFQLISFYQMAKYIKECKQSDKLVEHKSKYMFIHGMCAGIVLFIQPNLIGMWIPFGIGLAIILLCNKYTKNFFDNLKTLFFGVGIAFLPPLVYGIVNKCIKDMFFVMFGINFMYASDGRAGRSLGSFLYSFFVSPSGLIVLLAIMGVIVAHLYYRNILILFTLVSMLTVSIVFMSVNFGANPIYYTVYLPFCIPILIWLSTATKQHFFCIEIIIVVSMTVLLNMQLIKKHFRLGVSSYAYESAYMMEELILDKDSKVLVLGESLFYNCTGTLPHVKYFYLIGGGLRYENFPYCVDEQFDSLMSCENEYIIIQCKSVDEYSYWEDEERNKKMDAVLLQKYNLVLDYNEGGMHSVMWQRK